MRLKPGDTAPDFSVVDVYNTRHKLSDYTNQKLLLCFFRYAGCPFCNESLQKIIKAYPHFEEQNLKVLGFFQSPKESILEYPAKFNPPFPLIPDPDCAVYNQYGVEFSWAGFARGLSNVPKLYDVYVRKKMKQGKIDGDLRLMPAYFLIGPTGAKVYQACYTASFADNVPFVAIEDFLQFE